MLDINILAKHLAIQYSGSSDQYEEYKTVMAVSPTLYSHDFHCYNDTLLQRHSRNVQELNQLIAHLRSKAISPSALLHNVYNTFYPSYVLHHSLCSFLPLCKLDPKCSQLFRQVSEYQLIGAVFDRVRNWTCKQTSSYYPTLTAQNTLEMDENIFYYSSTTSLHAHVCCCIATAQNTLTLCFMRLRDSQGTLQAGIRLKDFGATISSDYQQVGYNLNQAKPIYMVRDTLQLKTFTSISLLHPITEFELSMKDLHKSLYLTITYTSMRKQFKTLQKDSSNASQQRPIITYQSVASRIIDAFALYVSLADWKSRLNQNPHRYMLFSKVVQHSHHSILEQLIKLRECCGGFGYLQVSGHPGCIERVALRASMREEQELVLEKQLLQVAHYYSSSDQLEEHYNKMLVPHSQEKLPLNYLDYFGIFVSICCQMRKQKDSMPSEIYGREFIKQSAIQAMHTNEIFSRHKPSNVHCLLLQYIVAAYILDKAKYINWKFLAGISRKQYFNGLKKVKAVLLLDIAKEIPLLGDTLELGFLRNVIVGSTDSNSFYETVLATSEANLRNSNEYLADIRRPIVSMLTENRAKL